MHSLTSVLAHWQGIKLIADEKRKDEKERICVVGRGLRKYERENSGWNGR